MHTLDKNSKPFKTGEYNDFFEAAELYRLVKEDLVAYSQSYAKMEETERVLQYALTRASTESYSEGFTEGEAVGFTKGIRDTAIKLKRLGIDFSAISEASGLSIDEFANM